MSDLMLGIAVIGVFFMLYSSFTDKKWKEYMKGPKKDE